MMGQRSPARYGCLPHTMSHADQDRSVPSRPHLSYKLSEQNTAMPELTPYDIVAPVMPAYHPWAAGSHLSSSGAAYWTLNITHSGAGYFPQINHLVLPGDCVLIPPHHYHEYGTHSEEASHWDHYWATHHTHWSTISCLATASSSAWFAALASRAYPQALYGDSLVERADEAGPCAVGLSQSIACGLIMDKSACTKTAGIGPHSAGYGRFTQLLNMTGRWMNWLLWSAGRILVSVMFLPKRWAFLPGAISTVPDNSAQGLLRGSESSIAAIARRVKAPIILSQISQVYRI